MQSSVPSTSGPLAGLRVVELGTLIAGPFCTRILAEFGAEVIKIEAPDGGDPLRTWRKVHEGTSLWWSVQSRNKKSVTVNLKTEAGQDVVRKLVRGADIVVENFRPGALEGWGLGYDRLAADNPGLVMVRLSGYGQTGPYRDQPGFGAIGEAMGGIRFVTGYPDRPPVRAGISLGDSVAALYGVIGALMAVYARQTNGGRGQVVDVALYEAVFSLMESLLPEFDVTGFVRGRSGASLPGIVPSNTYTCGDGAALVVAGNGDAIFKRLMNAIDRSDLADDPTLARNEGRVKRTDEIDQAIQQWCSGRSIDSALVALQTADVPASRIYSVADMFSDAQFAARDMIEQCALPDGTPLKVPAVVPKLSATPGGTTWLGPRLGEHTEEILRRLGHDQAAIAALRAQGVI
jgi:formyl-CoA transferase